MIAAAPAMLSAVFTQCTAADDGPTTRTVPRRAATAARPTRDTVRPMPAAITRHAATPTR